MSSRKEVPGLVIVPELFKIVDPNKEHYATRYKIYADRARQKLKFADTFISDAKLGFSYTQSMFEDTVIFFTTEIQLRDKTTGDLEWCGESPLTRAVLRKDRFSSSGIIVTPEITVSNNDKTIDIDLSAYIRYEGVAVLESTDYIIDNEITGEVVFKRELDKENLYSLSVPTSILESGKVYRIRARYRDVLGKYSNYADAIFGLDNFLDLIFPEDNMYLMYGKTLLLKPGVGNEPVFNGSDMKMVVSDINGVITTISYDNGFTINSLDYELGQILKCEIVYGLKRKTINVFITKTELSEEYDTNFEIKGLYKSLDASAFLLTGVSTAKQSTDGFIYDFNPATSKLVRIKYDDTANKINTVEDVLTIPNVDSTYNYRVLFNNPLGGLILFLSKSDGLGMQRIIFIDNNVGFSISKTVEIDQNIYGCVYNGAIVLDGLYLVAYSRSYIFNRYGLKKISINLLTKEIFDLGVASTNDFKNLRGLMPISLGGQITLARPSIHDTHRISDTAPDNIISSSTASVWTTLPKLGLLNGEDEMIFTHDAGNLYKVQLKNYKKDINIGTTILNNSQGASTLDNYDGIFKSPINGNLYTVPSTDQYVRITNPDTGVQTTITNATFIPANASVKYRGGVMTKSGKLYCAPYNIANTGARCMVVDTSNNTLTSIAISSTSTSGCWFGGVEGENYVYFAPAGDNRILVINLTSNNVSYIPTGLSLGANSYHHPAISKKYRRILFAPLTDSRIMLLNINNNEVSYIPIPDTVTGVLTLGRFGSLDIIDDRYAYFSPGVDKRVMILDLETMELSFIPLPTAYTYRGGLYDEKRRMLIIPVSGTTTSGFIYLEIPYNNEKHILRDDNNSVIEIANNPNPIDVVNYEETSRLTKLKNGKAAFILAPSIDNPTSGIVELDSETYELTDKRATVNDTVPHRIVYTLQDGRIITANNNRAVLFY